MTTCEGSLVSFDSPQFQSGASLDSEPYSDWFPISLAWRWTDQGAAAAAPYRGLPMKGSLHPALFKGSDSPYVGSCHLKQALS